MRSMLPKLKKLAAFGLPVAFGLLFLLFMISQREGPARKGAELKALPVRVVPVQETLYVPRLLGYGTVEPGQTWNAIAEVGGKIVRLHPGFKQGALLAPNTLLLKIDPSEYQIGVSKARAQVQSTRARIEELDMEQSNLASILDLERQNLRLAERDFRRNLSLVREGSVSETIMERAEQEVLRRRLQVTSRENNLRILPARRNQLEAQLEQNQASLSDAERRLGQTEIRVPYACRVAAKNVELGQAVRVGANLAECHGIDQAEIKAGVPLDKMRGLLKEGLRPFADGLPNPGSIIRQLGIKAIVRLKTNGPVAEWAATLSQIDASLDPATRTVGVIVTVDKPYHKAEFGVRPPLVKGMFCEVELRGSARKALVIPRAAFRDGRVLVVGADHRLQIRKVEEWHQSGQVVEIIGGPRTGELVVVSDIAPAIEGMLLEARLDTNLAEETARAAAAGGVR